LNRKLALNTWLLPGGAAAWFTVMDAGVTFKPLTPQSGELPPQPMVETNTMESRIAKSNLPANMFVDLLLDCYFKQLC
jgi:hypothetical protein